MRGDVVGIVGAGPFGTALASIVGDAGRKVVLWSSTADVVREINDEHTNRERLPGMSLPDTVRATGDPAELARAARLIVLAVSSVDVRDRAHRLGGALDGSHYLVHAIGAFAAPDDDTVTHMLGQETPCRQVGVLAGPALPGDLIEHRYASMVCASEFDAVTREARRLLAVPPHLRLYIGRDLLGVELAAALSGAYTIAMGMAHGLDIAAGPRSVLLTRAVAEASRLGEAIGGSARTFFGLAGLGNLLVRQAAEPRSAEFAYGLELAANDRSRERLPEGARAAHAGLRLAERAGVYMPVLSAIGAVLDGKMDALQAAAAAGETVAMEE